jgi:hypothetical protein
MTTPAEFKNVEAMIEDLADFIGPRVERQWGSFFGSMVTIYVPREGATIGNVTGWMHPSVRRNTHHAQVMLEALATLLTSLVVDVGVPPEILAEFIQHELTRSVDSIENLDRQHSN